MGSRFSHTRQYDGSKELCKKDNKGKVWKRERHRI